MRDLTFRLTLFKIGATDMCQTHIIQGEIVILVILWNKVRRGKCVGVYVG